MAREVYTKKEFIEFSSKFVFVRVLSDRDPKGAQLEERFQVRGYPTLTILDCEGKQVDQIVGGRPLQGLIEELELIFEYASDCTPI